MTVEGKKKFPVDDKGSADSAAHLINNGKGISPGQRSTIVRNIHKYDPGAKIPPAKGSKKKE